MAQRILLVEDDPQDAELTLTALEGDEVHYEVVVLRDGEEAFNYLFGSKEKGSEHELPIVLLLDLKLPKRTGLEVLQAVKNDPARQSIPVVMLTSSAEPRDVFECYRAGANAYVVKPLDFAAFYTAIQQTKRFWTGINHPPDTPERRRENNFPRL